MFHYHHHHHIHYVLLPQKSFLFSHTLSYFILFFFSFDFHQRCMEWAIKQKLSSGQPGHGGGKGLCVIQAERCHIITTFISLRRVLLEFPWIITLYPYFSCCLPKRCTTMGRETAETCYQWGNDLADWPDKGRDGRIIHNTRLGKLVRVGRD